MKIVIDLDEKLIQSINPNTVLFNSYQIAEAIKKGKIVQETDTQTDGDSVEITYKAKKA